MHKKYDITIKDNFKLLINYFTNILNKYLIYNFNY